MPILKKPAGPSEHHWCNTHIGTIGAVTCEICGTDHPEVGYNEPSYTISRFLGIQIIEECCGKLIDRVYEEFGEEFAMAYLEDFSENAGAAEFGAFRYGLSRTLRKAWQGLHEIKKEVGEAAGTAMQIESFLKQKKREKEG